MTNKFKRLLALALAVFMVIGMMPTNVVFATESDANQTVTDSLVAFYDFSAAETTTVYDATGNGNNATLINGATVSADPRGIGYVLDLTNNGSAASAKGLSLPVAMFRNIEDVTIVMDVYLDSTATWMCLLNAGVSRQQKKYMTFVNEGNDTNTYIDGKPIGECGISNATSEGKGSEENEKRIYADPDTKLKVGQWGRVALRHVAETGEAEIYLNNVLVAKGTLDITLQELAQDEGCEVRIGSNNIWNDPGLNGLVDNVRIYSKALSEEELAAIPAVTIDTAEELAAALKAGGEVKLEGDLVISGTELIVPENVTTTLDLAGHTLTFGENDAFAIQGSLTIVDSVGGGKMTGSGDVFQNSDRVTITGGTFSFDVSSYVAEGYEAKDNGDGTYTVREKSAYVAMIGDQGYETLALALAAAEAGDVIQILEGEYTFEDTATILIDKAVTIQGAGRENTTLSFDSAASAFTIASSGVTFSDMTIKQGAQDNSSHISISKGAWDAPAIQYSDITIQNIDFVGGNYALCLIGENVVVDSCTFTDQSSHNILIYSVKGESKIIDNTFNASTGNNKSAILFEGGVSTTLTDEQLAAFLGGGTLTIDGNAANSKGVFFQFTNWGLVKDMNVAITNNKIDAFTNKAIAVYTETPSDASGDEFASFTVSKNVFTNVPTGRTVLKEYTGKVEILVSENYLGSAEPDLTTLFAGDKVKVTSYYEDDTLTKLVDLTASAYVAQVGETQYKTLAEAVDAAEAGATVKLLTDVELTATLAIAKDITLDLNGKTIEYTNGYCINQTGGNVFITGNGTITGSTAPGINVSAGNLTIENGTFDAGNYPAVVANGNGSITLLGGTYKIITGNSSVFAIYGGTFYADPSTYVKTGATVKADTDAGTWTVTYDMKEGLIYGVGNLLAALNSGKDAKLGANISIWADLEVLLNDSNVTLDLNGYTITSTNGKYLDIKAAADGATGSLTIKDSSEAGTGAISTNNHCIVTAMPLTIENGSITCNGYGVLAEGANAVVTINDGTFNCKSWDLYNNGGTVTINGGTFAKGVYEPYGSAAAGSITINGGTFGQVILNKASAIAINGGTFNGQVNAVTASSFTITGGTFNGQVNAGSASSFTITGGTFNEYVNAGNASSFTIKEGTFAGHVTYGYASTEIYGGTFTNSTLAGTPGGCKIYGGTFSFDVSSYVAEGYEAVESDGTYTVQKKTAVYVAMIGDQGYETLAEAVDAAASGATVTLLSDASGAGVKISKDVTIDFGGCTYTFTSAVGSASTETNGFQILKDNAVTLKNGTLKVADDSASDFGMIIQNYANLTITDMTLDGTNLDKASYSYVLSNNSGNVVIGGKTNIIANDSGDAYAFDVYDYSSAGYDVPTVSVNTTGTISGKIEVSESISGNLTISGGTFTQDVSAWMAADRRMVAEEGSYTVTGDGIWTFEVTDADDAMYSASGADANDLFAILDRQGFFGPNIEYTLTLNYDVKIDDPIVFKWDVITGEDFDLTINLNGHTLTNYADEVYPMIRVAGGANVTIKNGTITNDDYVFVLGASDGSSAGNLTIESGSYTGETTVASVTKGTLTINGGEFAVTESEYGATYLLNCLDANYADDSANIVVTGGTFTGFNPEKSESESGGANFVADGYTAVDNDDGTYTVMTAADAGYVAQNTDGTYFATVSDALTAAASGETVKLITDCEEGYVLVTPGVTLDLNGNTLTAKYVVALGAGNVIDSVRTGLLKVAQNNIVLDEGNAYVPVWNTVDGYTFTQLKITDNAQGMGLTMDGDVATFKFVTFFRDTNLLTDGVTDNNLSVVIRVSWTTTEGTAYQDFVYNDEHVGNVVSANGRQAFKLTFTGCSGLENLTFTPMVLSGTRAAFCGNTQSPA